MSDVVPARFQMMTGAHLGCEREDCDWWLDVGRQPLTEIVALAREHVEEAHRGN